MEKVRKISKRYYVRQIVACWLVLWMGFGLPLRVAMADPSPSAGALPGGLIDRVGIDAPVYDLTSGFERMDMTQTASEAIVNWGNFDIGSTATVEFTQPNSAAAVLNRVHDGTNVTGIMGTLTANGRVFVINPAGIIFGSNSSVNVAQLVASSLGITDGDFLNGLPNTFTGGATAGDVINEGDTTITAEQIALIGKNVINRGTLVAPDGYVIMAAGETVVISQSSPVSVVVSMPAQTPGAYDYTVDNDGDIEGYEGNTDHVILAAGDIWSQAIEGVETLRAEAKGNVDFDGEIYAYSDGGSDAVADVTIITGGNFTVDDEIMAEADAPSGFNSFATVTIDAGGNVTVNDLVKAEADADNTNSGNATATVNILADGDVTINEIDDDEAVHADVWVDDSGHGTATLNINAGGRVQIFDYLKAEAEGDDSGNMSATVDITGVGSVDIDDRVEAEADAENSSGNAAATVNIRGESVTVDENGGDWAVDADAYAGDNSGNATANLNINADRSVDIDGDVRADADTRNYSDNATAGIVINAGQSIDIRDDVEALSSADEYSGNASSSLDIDAGENVHIYEHNGETVKAKAETWDSGNATADIDIDAATGSVTIDDAVKAIAKAKDNSGNAKSSVDINAGTDVTINDFSIQADDMVWSEADARNGSGNADATLGINAGRDVVVNREIEAEAEAAGSSDNATAGVTLIASRDILLDEDVDADADTWNSSGDASATLTLNAGRDVTIDNADAEADAYSEDASGNATALLDIDAVGNILLKDGADDTKADAYVSNAKGSSNGDATATVTVDAGGNLTLDGSLGNAELEAEAETYNGSGDATGSITVVADNVYLDGDNNNAEIEVDADTHSGSGDATGTIDITLNGSDVIVDGGDADIMVDVETHDGDGDDDAKAEIIIKGADNVNVSDEGEIKARARAYDASGDATALIDIEAGSVYVAADDGDIKTRAQVWNDQEGIAPSDATATTKIDVGTGNVTLYDNVKAKAEVWNDYGDLEGVAGDATATVDIDAGNLTVGNRGDLEARAYMQNDDDGEDGTFSGDAKAEVDITLTGSLLVESRGEIDADSDIDNGGDSLYSGDAIAVIDIEAGGDVTVEEGDSEGRIEANADIDNYDNQEINTYTGNADADVYITSLGAVTVDGMVKARADVDNQDSWELGRGEHFLPGDIYSGSAYANVWIDNAVDGKGDGVTVGPDGEILALAEIIISDYWGDWVENNVYSGDAEAGIDIESCGDVIVDGLIKSEADFWIEDDWIFNDEYSGDTYADVIVKAYGDVVVNSEDDEENGTNAQIEALATDGEQNTAGITVLAVGNVIVNNGSDSGRGGPFINSREEIRAAAFNGSTNNAFVGIATRDGFGGNVEVSGQIGARTANPDWQWWEWCFVEEGTTHTNTSNVQIYADQDLIVYGGYADIEYYVPEGDPIQYYVVDSEEGGQIFAGAQGSGPESVEEIEDLVSFNNANVEIYADRDVIVHGAELELTQVQEPIKDGDGFFDGGQIIALTRWNDYSANTSYVGISAQRDVTVGGPTITGDLPDEDPPEEYDIYGQVLAGAHGDGSLNDADIEICAQDDATVNGDIEATAGTGALGLGHSAHIVIAAGDLIDGSGSIIADADPDVLEGAIVDAGITFYITDVATTKLLFDGEAYSTTDEGATETPPNVEVVDPVDLDCPECNFDDWDWINWEWCEDCEVPGFVPAAAIVPFVTPLIAGCPTEMGAAALELGITPETIQFAIADALALNPSIQPCEACAALIDAAAILRDEDGSRMAAMLSVFNELAPTDAPFTPEMSASIATAFAGAAEGSQYASVAEYVDAFVQYVAVVDVDLGAPIDDSLAFVMGKYGTGITGSDNANIAAFVAARLESGATFGN